MKQDEKLILQILQSYHDGELDFSKVPALNELVDQAVNQQFQGYIKGIDRASQEALERRLSEIDQQAQQKLEALDREQLKRDFQLEIQTERDRMTRVREKFLADEYRMNQHDRIQASKNRTFILANFSLFAVLLLFVVLFMRWILFDGIWKGWGLNLLFKTILGMYTYHPYLAFFLGIFAVLLISLVLILAFGLAFALTAKLGDQVD